MDTAADIAAAFAAGERSALELIEATMGRIAERNRGLNAFTTVTAERALSCAASLDAARAAGHPPGPLAGVPFAVKNLIDIAGLPTVAGSHINRDRAPARCDATAVQRLERAGAVLVGALNMGEYAYDFTGENAHDGPSRNPLDPARMTGGSSGGSGGAVGGGLVPIALGSDTNGSIRVPASFCGTFGLKPTFGRVSRAGSFPFAASLDHLGPLARCTRDLALALDALQGPDPRDPTCAEHNPEPVTHTLEQGVEGLRIGVLGGYFQTGAVGEALGAVATVAAAFGTARETTLPHADVARAAADVITAAEAGTLHLPRLRTRAEEFDPDVRDRLIAGALMPAPLVTQAQKFRRWYREAVLALFARFDVLIAPATPCLAPLIGEKTLRLGDRDVALRPNIGVYTQPLSFIGLPVAVVPIPTGRPLPIGVQLIAAPWRDDLVLRAASVLEQCGVTFRRGAD